MATVVQLPESENNVFMSWNSRGESGVRCVTRLIYSSKQCTIFDKFLHYYKGLVMRSCTWEVFFYVIIAKNCQKKFYMACKIHFKSMQLYSNKKIFSMLVEYKYFKNHVNYLAKYESWVIKLSISPPNQDLPLKKKKNAILNCYLCSKILSINFSCLVFWKYE